jgi:rod shape determining protein RodA
MWSRARTIDPLLYVLPLICSVIGVVFIGVLTSQSVGNSLVIRQVIATILGVIAMFGITLLDYRGARAWRIWFGIGLLLSLAAVLVFGSTQFGAKSWIDFGPIQFQPGEFAKVILPFAIAGLLQPRGNHIAWRSFLLAGLAVMGTIGLILLQPDLGTAIVIVTISMAVFLHAPLRLMQRIMVWSIVAAGVLTITLSFMNVGPFTNILKPYQKNRLISFIDVKADPRGSGYNVIQAKIAVGSGGLLGRGIGYGSQSQLNFLPVVHTDFIFAAIAESWGFVGSLGVVGIFIVLVQRILHAAKIAQDSFGNLLCIGAAAAILVELIINVGMNIGVMPVTGIPLPFISYGGTAVITFYCMMGVVQSVVVRAKRLTF